MAKKELTLFLAHCPQMGFKRSMFILKNCSSLIDLKNNLERVFIESGLKGKHNLEATVKKFLNNFCVEDTINKYKQKNIEIVSIYDDDYPSLLRQTYDFPPLIFCKGDIALLRNSNSVGIVGARLASWYGKTIARDFGEKLSKRGIVIVSGMAKGIDACAHEGALQGRAKSIGVLGCGLDIVYPKENKKLFNKMEENGLLVSTYPLGTKPIARNFPARNRIISGLSKGVVIVEAKRKSGALITTDFALEQGRDVFSVPGNINSPLSMGTNHLIKEGAIVATNVDAILAEYIKNNDLDIVDTDKINSVKLDKVEQKILEIAKGQRISFEQLVQEGNFSTDSLLAGLLTLEIKGLVKKDGNQMYIPVVTNIDTSGKIT
ncbi:DNA-processing protein DprA [Proteinivorax tanatarense]|uniref:DNA-processing protein DprA n=1 Tax=Proteinivorax tanatarense TaxID=1260629 RepID=A0AAU7VPX7_9FIRM